MNYKLNICGLQNSYACMIFQDAETVDAIQVNFFLQLSLVVVLLRSLFFIPQSQSHLGPQSLFYSRSLTQVLSLYSLVVVLLRPLVFILQYQFYLGPYFSFFSRSLTQALSLYSLVIVLLRPLLFIPQSQSYIGPQS